MKDHISPLLTCLLLLLAVWVVHAQDGDLARITPENAAQVTGLAILEHGWINDLIWTPDGAYLAVAGSAGLWLHDSATLDAEPRLLAGHDDTWSVAFSPDMARVALGGSSGTVQVRNLATNEVLHELPCRPEESGWHAPVQSIAFSPEGTFLACGAESVLLFDALTGELLALFEGESSVAFSPDGLLLGTAGVGGARLWDAHTYRLLATMLFSDPASRGVDLDFSPEGFMLAVGTRDGAAHVWLMPIGLRDLEEPRTYPRHYVLHGQADSPWNRVDFGPDWTTLAVGGRYLWDLSAAESDSSIDSASVRTLHMEQGNPTAMLGVAFDPGGALVAGANGLGVVTVWDAATGDVVATISDYNTGGAERGGAYRDGISITSVAFSPDGRMLAAGTGGYMTTDGAVHLWDVRQRAITHTLPGDGSLMDLAFSSALQPDDGDVLLATANAISGVRLWDVTRGEMRHALTEEYDVGESVALSPDGSIVAAATGTRTQLWDTTTGGSLGALDNEAFVYSVAFSPISPTGDTGFLLATGGDDGVVRLWDVQRHEMLTAWEAHPGAGVWCVAFSPEGALLATAGDMDDLSVRVWDAATGEPRAVLETGAQGLAFSPDGRVLATGGGWNNPTLHLWNVATGELLATLTGHTMAVADVAFSPDGSLLVSGGWNGTTRLWGVPE